MCKNDLSEEAITEADLVRMDPDELDAWILAHSPALNSFPLHTDEGRRGFLHELCMRGYSALFEGVAHVWALMESPKADRCFGLGLAAGTGGTSKIAVLKFLTKMIDDGLATFRRIPSIHDFDTIHEWNDAVNGYAREDAASLAAVIEYYADLMVAHPFAPKPSLRFGKVIQGPWSTMPK